MATLATAVDLLQRVTCPHCWGEFAPEDTLWISAHSDLFRDSRLPDENKRFPPSRFSVRGKALDMRGMECSELACPHCHLQLPPVFLEMPSLFVSIFGSPFCGKSNYLTAMTWQLKTKLLSQFRLRFESMNPQNSQLLGENQTKLFNNPEQDTPVLIDKTQQAGELYQGVRIKGQRVLLPKPMVFAISPDQNHPAYDPQQRRNPLSRVLALYDNAGEHFLPGGASATQPCKHLALSGVRLFLFDPTQHPKIRAVCQANSDDPQFRQNENLFSQDQVLAEAARRIRNDSSPRLQQGQKIPGHLVVVVSKFDSCRRLCRREELLRDPIVGTVADNLPSALNMDVLDAASADIKAMLLKYAGEIVSEAEGAFQHVTYIPVSALGRAPEKVDPNVNLFLIRPRDVESMWTEVPMLFALNMVAKRLVPFARFTKTPGANGPPNAGPPNGMNSNG